MFTSHFGGQISTGGRLGADPNQILGFGRTDHDLGGLVINIDDGGAIFVQQLKQPGFGRRVVRHVLVVIQMVTGQIGKNRH